MPSAIQTSDAKCDRQVMPSEVPDYRQKSTTATARRGKWMATGGVRDWRRKNRQTAYKNKAGGRGCLLVVWVTGGGRRWPG